MPLPLHSDKEACTRRVYEISFKDLPLSCPPRDRRVWDAHPRVYLPIEETEDGTFICPYCDAKYILEGFEKRKECPPKTSGDTSGEL